MTRHPRVFISRTTAGLKALAERVAEVLRQRGIEPIIQTGFYPSTHDVKGMLADHLQQCDAVICLIGTAYGSGPHDPITKAEQPVHGLKDSRTKDRPFSYTQLELLIARDLGRPIYTFFIEGDELPAAFASEPAELAQRQQTFITEFAKDGRNTYGTFSQWDQPSDPARGLKQTIEAIKFEITVLAGKPTNLPYTSLGTLFKGRDEFLAELRQHLTAEGPVVIKGKRTIHGMGGVGKTRAAIEYAWKHADDYRALLFISADTPEALHRNLAALCGPLVLNLPEQNEKEQALQVEAALRWLKLHPGWFLIIDNVDTDEAAEETKALLAKLTTGHVLITSRISDWTGHVKSLDLDVLSEAASIAFLDERTEERRPKRDNDREQVAALVQLLDCLALALEQAGAHISASAISYADYLSLWESHRSDALAWHDAETMKYPKSLAITFETSVTQLSDGAKELFRILSWFAPEPIPRSLLDSRPNPADEKRHLGEIERLHLARYLGDGKVFAIHRLNQEIAKQWQREPHPADPAALGEAVYLLDNVLQGDYEDPETWSLSSQLTAHSLAAACSAAMAGIGIPTGHLLNQTYLYLMNRADYRGANLAIRTALDLAVRLHGEMHVKTAVAHSNLAQLLIQTNCLNDAEFHMRTALRIESQIYGENHIETTTCMNNLARLLYVTGRYTDAEAMFRRVISVEEMEWHRIRKQSAAPLNNLGILLHTTNRLLEAEACFREALSINISERGQNHPTTATIASCLACLLNDLAQPEEAERLFRTALEITKRNLGGRHPETAIRLANLAIQCSNHERLHDGLPLIKEALEIYLEIHGNKHPNSARCRGILGLLLKQLGLWEEAEAELREAHSVLEQTLGAEHCETIEAASCVGLLMTEVDRASDALPLLEDCVRKCRRAAGENNPLTSVCLNNLAIAYRKLDQPQRAESVMLEAISITLDHYKQTGRISPHHARIFQNYGGLRMEMGDTQDEADHAICRLLDPTGLDLTSIQHPMRVGSELEV